MPTFTDLTRQDWIVLTRIGVSVIVLAIAAIIILSKAYLYDDLHPEPVKDQESGPLSHLPEGGH